jgi:hypothetical protein
LSRTTPVCLHRGSLGNESGKNGDTIPGVAGNCRPEHAKMT